MWKTSTKDAEVVKLEEKSRKVRQEVHELRERGRKLRLHRLEALDALEMRRVTLAEIFKRMDKELMGEDVYTYADVLAEVFGERKIFAHRAIGLESLLCQFMHQMLAKQHQLKIIKKSAKDIQNHYKKYKDQNRDEFHSFEALAVQLEASRLSLEAMYDDIFAAQHSLLAQLKHVETHGNMTNYSIPPSSHTQVEREQPRLSVSTKHNEKKDLSTPVSFRDSGEDDYTAAMSILNMEEKKHSPKGERRSSEKSARERRRQIEHLRQARVVGGASTRNVGAKNSDEEGDSNARERMRDLEASRLKTNPSSESTDSPGEQQARQPRRTSKLDVDDQLQTRQPRRNRSNNSLSNLDADDQEQARKPRRNHSNNSLSNLDVDGQDQRREEARRKRMERRKERSQREVGGAL